MSVTPSIELHFRSQVEVLSVVRACVERFAHVIGFDAEWSSQVALAVDEAITNVIRHGYGGRQDGPIMLRLSALSPAGLRVELEDEGCQIDPAALKPRDLTEVRPGGLGMHIIRSTFERCEWRTRSLRGMSALLELGLPTQGRRPTAVAGRTAR
jgi:anti-sigma regulatory factor (Ser/Thr protein kinase)